MELTLSEYKKELHLDIEIESTYENQFPEESFFTVITEQLSEAGVLDNVEYSPFKDTPKGIRVDGYCWNELEKTLTVLVARLSENPENEESLTQGDIDTLAKRASKFN